MSHLFVRFPRFRFSSCGLRAGYGVQVGGQNPPSYPSAEAFLALLPASAQITPAFHHADAPLDPRSKAPRSPEPPLPLVALALLALGSLLGQPHPFDAPCFGRLLRSPRSTPPGRPPPATAGARTASGDSPGRLAIASRLRVAFEYPIAAYDAPFRLLQPHLVPELGLLARLASRDDRSCAPRRCSPASRPP